MILIYYRNLHELISSSKGTREYFLSLAPEKQLDIAKFGDFIHTAAELRLCVSRLDSHTKAVSLSDSLFTRHL